MTDRQTPKQGIGMGREETDTDTDTDTDKATRKTPREVRDAKKKWRKNGRNGCSEGRGWMRGQPASRPARQKTLPAESGVSENAETQPWMDGWPELQTMA